MNNLHALPITSVIIPCYNSGVYLLEAIESVEQNLLANECEIIIVDDGSNDDYTLGILKELDNSNNIILRQINKGPAAARNAGSKVAKGKYLFFLDSDNKIKKNIIKIGKEILEANDSVGVVYTNVSFFSDNEVAEARFSPSIFEINKIILGNYIDMCSMVRKSMFQSLGGLDEERILIGHEDWEFWIRVYSSGWELYFVDEILFEYRVRINSLITQISSKESLSNTYRYVIAKHYNVFMTSYSSLKSQLADMTAQYTYYQNDKKRPFRSFIKYLTNMYLRQK